MLHFLSPHIPGSELIDRSSVWFRFLRVAMLLGALISWDPYVAIYTVWWKWESSSRFPLSWEQVACMVCVVQCRRKVNRGGNNISHSDFIWRIFCIFLFCLACSKKTYFKAQELEMVNNMFWKNGRPVQSPMKANGSLHSARVRSLILSGIGSVDHTLSLCIFC